MTNILIEYANHECAGCGKNSDELAIEESWTDEDFDSYSVTTNCGFWYCHTDCYRDSH